MVYYFLVEPVGSFTHSLTQSGTPSYVSRNLLVKIVPEVSRYQMPGLGLGLGLGK